MGWRPVSVRSMMASRRWASPTGPSIHAPWPSGPRCAISWFIRSRVAAWTGSPFSWTTPQMPHISALGRHDGESARLLVESRDARMRLLAPLPHLGFCLAVRVARAVSVEVDVNVLLEGGGVVPVELGEVPVDDPLHVFGARLDAQQRYVLVDLDARVEIAQLPGQHCEGTHRLPRLGVGHARDGLPDVVVGELADGPFAPVHVEVHLAPAAQQLRRGADRLPRRGRVVKHPLREGDLERSVGEGETQGVGLDEDRVRDVAEQLGGDVDRVRDVEAYRRRLATPGLRGEERPRRGAGAAAQVEHPRYSGELARPLSRRSEPVLLKQPGGLRRVIALAEQPLVALAPIPLERERFLRLHLALVVGCDEAGNPGHHRVNVAPLGAELP